MMDLLTSAAGLSQPKHLRNAEQLAAAAAATSLIEQKSGVASTFSRDFSLPPSALPAQRSDSNSTVLATAAVRVNSSTRHRAGVQKQTTFAR